MKALNPAVARVLKRLHFPLDVILTCVRWYVAYPLSLRHLEENDGSARRFGRSRPEGSPLGGFDCAPLGHQAAAGIGESVRRRKRPVGKSWRMDETYIRVKGEWRYLYRAVDKDCNTIDFLLRAHQGKAAARRYLEKSMARNGVPETVTIDKSGANLAALEAINDARETPIKIRQSKYLNNLVEQDHRALATTRKSLTAMTGAVDAAGAAFLRSGSSFVALIEAISAASSVG
jgi:putative transposase